MLEGKIKYALYGFVSSIAAKARLTIARYSSGFKFVVDSSDHEWIDEARDELSRMLSDESLHGTPLLVFANKQGRQWHVQGTCATSGAGLHDGLDWLCSTLSSAK
ncbi:hypothetical protein AAHC03_019190 [Spirometra sp. Aus1]